VSSYFVAGGIAGAASRTVVSPLERLKIIQYVSLLWSRVSSLTAALIDKFSLDIPASSTRECGKVSFACGGRKVSRD